MLEQMPLLRSTYQNVIKSDETFWKGIKNLCNIGSDVIASTVDGITG